MEYCCTVWCPYQISHNRKLESVQRKFTKHLLEFKHVSYKDRLTSLKVDTLEFRRIISDLVMYYKIIHNYVHISKETFFSIGKQRHTRGHALTINKRQFHCNLDRYAFRNRRIDIWNSLPSHIVNASNIKVFKTALNKIPKKFFIKYLYIS